MKFAKVFQQVLEDDHIPEEWISSAIQYKALKKCINKVVEELEEFGLEKDTLQALLDYQQTSTSAPTSATPNDRPIVSYEFEDALKGFVPKLSVTIDTLSDLPVNAQLSPATLEKIKHIAEIKSSRISVVHKPSSPEVTATSSEDSSSLPSSSSSSSLTDLEEEATANPPAAPPASSLKVVEIKLRSDSEFFYLLTSELTQLDMLKKAQEAELIKLIDQLTNVISKAVDPNKSYNRIGRRPTDMYVWREIFKEYIDAGVFFSTMESDSGAHDAEVARQRLLFFAQRVMGDPDHPISLRQFQQKLQEQQKQQELESVSSLNSEPTPQTHDNALPDLETSDTYENETGPYSRALSLLTRVRHLKHTEQRDDSQHHNGAQVAIAASSPRDRRITPAPNSLLRRLRHPNSRPAFKSFWILNNALLQALQFQTLNKTAITKILKKFDKQTALTSRHSFPLVIAQENHPFISTSLAKSICFVMGERLLPVTPQIDDFLCPICMSITYKPIRLDCTHVFCVRCLVHLQRSREDRCPICRAMVVLDADERNLDEARLAYLKLYFPKETKEKQAETEKQIAKEQMDQLRSSGECVIQ